MTDVDSPSFIMRDQRRPLFVQVQTRPRLRDCWSVDVSRTGIGLGYASGAAGPPIIGGQPLQLELALPDSGTVLRADGVVAWVDERAHTVEGFVGTSLGVRFTKMSGGDRLALAQYLSGQGPHVIVSDATATIREVLERSIGERAHLHFTRGLDELGDLAGRGDVGVVVIGSRDAEFGLECLEQVWTSTQAMRTQAVAAAADVTPRVIYLSPTPPQRLVELMNDGRIYRALTDASPLDASSLDALVGAIRDAYRDYGVRTEQHRATIALQRALSRRRPPDTTIREVRKAVTDVVISSPAMRHVMDLAKTAAPHRVSVLLQGETGVGKDVMARLIHELSDRADEPFVVQDCGALTETLLESELFGHVKGAFTSAIASHPGLFALADGGTVFLDEIENTTPAMQAKLLRALESGQVRPVGGTQERAVDIRLIVASNRDLETEVSAGRFRSDLYYRLNTFPIHVPALRARPEDVLPLVEHFLANTARTMGRDGLQLTPAAQALLVGHDWPGNIRELRNVIERAALLCGDDALIGPAHLPEGLASATAAPISLRNGDGGGTLRERLAQTEREMIKTALEQNNGVIRRAAMELGMNPVTLARRMRRLEAS